MADLRAEAVSEGLTVWSLLGLGNTPRDISPQMGVAWLLALKSIGTTNEEWQWARSFIATEKGRRYWPSTPEICDLIRERRRQREAEKDWFLVGGQLRRFHPDEVKALEGS